MKRLLFTTIAAVLFGMFVLQLIVLLTQPSIHEASRTGNIEVVKQHLTDGVDVNSRGKNEWTPLHYAAEQGHKEITELLIGKAADVNARDKYGVTPLYKAADWGHREILELLITKGADVNKRNILGETALNSAIAFKQPEIAEILRKHGGKTSEELKVSESVAKAAKPETDPAELLRTLMERRMQDTRKNGSNTAETLNAEGK